MKTSDRNIDKIEEALVNAYHQQEDLQFPPEWRHQVMQDIESMAGPAAFPPEKAGKTTNLKVIAALASLSLAVFAGWLILANVDWRDPWLLVKYEVTSPGSKPICWLEAGDEDSGLRSLTVTIIQKEFRVEVLSKNFEPAGGLRYFPNDIVNKVKIPVPINAQDLGLQAGEATLVVTARDLSWRNGFQGRQTVLTKKIVIYQSP